jgi:sulfite reductase (ferredoxin)
VLVGGGNIGDGDGKFADKVVKIPSKRGPEALRIILNDFDAHGGELSYPDYYAEKEQMYFYDLLKHLTDVDNLTPSDFIDWGTSEDYVQAIGVGECAGVVIDLIATLLFESEEKIDNAENCLLEQKWAASIYHSYSAMVNTAKAMLTMENVKTNTHISIIKDFDEKFVEPERIAVENGFENLALQINKNEPTEAFATQYLKDTKQFLNKVQIFRTQELAEVTPKGQLKSVVKK